ncbi:MAG: tripartite tricarboxylate transporter TctB family protein [Vicinamibacterales bacterium]
MKLPDTATGGVILVFGLAVALYARTFPPMPGQNVGPGLLPTAIGVMLAALGAVILASGLSDKRTEIVASARWTRPMAIKVIAVIADLVFYISASNTLGFFITSFVFLCVLLAAFGANRRALVPVSAVATLAIHYGFYTLLHVPLPWGLLERIAW